MINIHSYVDDLKLAAFTAAYMRVKSAPPSSSTTPVALAAVPAHASTLQPQPPGRSDHPWIVSLS